MRGALERRGRLAYADFALDATDEAPRPPSGRVLLVEDEPVQSRLIGATIAGMGEGWQVEPVSTGRACLEALEARTFVIVLLDLVLPDGSGLDVLRSIRERGWVVPTVLMTAHGDERIAVEALRLGVLDYVTKEEGYLHTLPGVIKRAVEAHRERLQAISRHTRLQLELARRSQSRVLDSFAAPIVHDIRSPLSRISMTAEILMRTRSDDEPLCRGLLQVLKSVELADNLLERLVRFARAEHEEHVLVDLCDLLHRLVDRENQQLRFQNVRVLLFLPEGPVRIVGAPGGIEQVVLNLLSNSTDAMVRSRSGGTIEVRVSTDQRYARVVVSDEGPGIPAALLGEIFKPGVTFGKGHRGTGLGLAIVDTIVREHGGQVRVQSEPGSGAQFTIRLPLSDHGPMALVLEDEETVQELLRSQLASLGVRAEVLGDGRHVMERIAEGHFDLLVLDIRTPGVDGVAVIETLVRTRPDLAGRTMIVSGCIEDRALQDLLQHHPVPCLPKPYSVHDFNDIVRLLLRRSR